MRYPFRLRATALFVAGVLAAASSFAFAQDGSLQQTRPRRVSDVSPRTEAIPSSNIIEVESERFREEPVIRVGLATDVRAATVSTAGRLLNASEINAPPAPLAVARVRVEPRALLPSAIGSTGFAVEIAGAAAARHEAERAVSDIRELTGDEPALSHDARTNSWKVRVGKNRSREEAEELRAQLEEAGFATTAIVEMRSAQQEAVEAGSRSTSLGTKTNASSKSGGGTFSPANAQRSNTVRTASRITLPTRELIAFDANSAALLNSRAPLVFASDDELSAPVRFNEKPYRGRLEVFPNARGTLTVVNVIGLEDYVRGVVPNELSPGSYPALEALKAQAIAARTYAVKNRGQYASLGFDLLPTTRSQVYKGVSTEHTLASRAVEETRGIVATYEGEPINALYTSTCGGRTEDVEHIFKQALPYLRGRECAIEGRSHFAPFTIKTARPPADIRDEANAALARAAALLAVHSFKLPSSRVTDAWLSAPVPLAEVRAWLSGVARLTRQGEPIVSDDVTHPGGFSTALAAAVYGAGRADTLLTEADISYILSFRDAAEVAQRDRADVALLLRDGYLALYPDATLRPREAMSRARMMRVITRLLEARGVFQIQKAAARPASAGALVLRSGKGRDQSVAVSRDAFLFRAFGENVYQVSSLALVGGEPVLFHVNGGGEVDYLEVRPAPDGAASDRFSPFANWTKELSLIEAQSRLSRSVKGIGSLLDLRVAARGSSRRAVDLEIVGTNGVFHLRGGRIRSALGLREQLFVIDRRHDPATGRVTGFSFTGRGYGHGVGMCQVGAYGMARSGWTHDKILKAYYTGIDLTKLY